ncbi:MAG: hypothetical protein ABSG16_19090 [Candidatus Acidiferrum sp.]
MEKEQPALDAVLEGLREGRPFEGPPGVSISKLNAETAGPFDLRFELKSGSNKVFVLGEVKRHVTPKQLEQISPWIARLKSLQPETAVAIIAPYMSPQAQKFCIENAIDFIDLAGNLSVNVPGKFTLQRLGVIGKSESDARENTRIQNVYSGKASRVLRVLLQKPRTWSLTTLGNELTAETRINPLVGAASDVRRGTFEISLGSISKALSTLDQELWIRRRNSAIVVPEPVRLLSQWAEKYKERYRWRLRGSFTCTNPFGVGLRSVAESLNRIAPGQFAFTGAAAASLSAPFIDIDKFDLFVTSAETAVRIREMSVGQGIGPSIRVSSPYDFGVFMYATYEGSVPVVSDLQSYLDLYSRGGRDLKQAQYFLENRIQTNWNTA